MGGALRTLVAAALALPKLRLLVVAWRLAGWGVGEVERKAEEDHILGNAWRAISAAGPVPHGHHLESNFFHVRDRRGWRLGFLAIGPRLPGRRPRMMSVAEPGRTKDEFQLGEDVASAFHLESLHHMGFQTPPHPGRGRTILRTEIHLVRFAPGESDREEVVYECDVACDRD